MFHCLIKNVEPHYIIYIIELYMRGYGGGTIEFKNKEERIIYLVHISLMRFED